MSTVGGPREPSTACRNRWHHRLLASSAHDADQETLFAAERINARCRKPRQRRSSSWTVRGGGIAGWHAKRRTRVVMKVEINVAGLDAWL